MDWTDVEHRLLTSYNTPGEKIMSNQHPGRGRAGRRFPYLHLDVFSSRPLEGNQLAVFSDARGLSTREMQALAREMNLSETTFVLPRDRQTEARRGVKVRIFTTQEELNFAGHPTLGTAFALRRRDQEEVILDLRVGRIPVRFRRQRGAVFGEMTQRDPEMRSIHDKEAVARAAGLALSDFDPDLPVQTVSTGTAFAIVPVRALATVQNLGFSWKSISAYLERTDAQFLYFVTRETVRRTARLHARMVFYNGEDPATGSAAGCCAAWMVAHGVAVPEEQVEIEQGLEIRRPSRIFVRAGRSGNRIVNVRVGGSVVEIIRGEAVI
jgi:trans-2,3-dihydro-3-hydroxyanthranilate isomerase